MGIGLAALFHPGIRFDGVIFVQKNDARNAKIDIREGARIPYLRRQIRIDIAGERPLLSFLCGYFCTLVNQGSYGKAL
jgi:hypothetical protein